MTTPSESLKTLAENEKWLQEHKEQTVRPGDLPLSDTSPALAPQQHDNQQ